MRKFFANYVLSGENDLLNRNYGIDLLKIIAMHMVLVLHILGIGGGKNKEILSLEYELHGYLEVMCYCAVNVFAITTGYLMVDRKCEYYKVFLRWLQVFFYSVSITLICVFVAGIDITQEELLISLFPTTFCEWKYFTSYFGTFLFMPYMNAAVNGMDQKTAKNYFLVIFLFCSVWTTFTLEDPMNMLNGYSFIWILLLYIVGGLMKKCGLFSNTESKKAIVLYLLCVTFSWLIRFITESAKIESLFQFSNMFINYTSPTILLNAVMLMVVFSKIEIKNQRIQNIIKMLSTVSFGVFLIHSQIVIRNHVFANAFGWIAELNIVVSIITIIITALVLYMICGTIEYLRSRFFERLHVGKNVKLIFEKTAERMAKY